MLLVFRPVWILARFMPARRGADFGGYPSALLNPFVSVLLGAVSMRFAGCQNRRLPD